MCTLQFYRKLMKTLVLDSQGDWKEPFNHKDELEELGMRGKKKLSEKHAAKQKHRAGLQGHGFSQDACHNKGFHCILGDREKA